MPILLATLLLILLAGEVRAEGPGVPALALEAEAEFTLDGRLDEPWWSAVTPIEDLRQVFPDEGSTPGDRTEVRFAYTAKMLYVAIRCQDREPDLITARSLQRDSFEDESFPADDFVQVVLDPFGRGRDGYLFAVNPLGTMTDGRIEQSTVTRVEWDGLWDARAERDGQGWTAELAIPFSSLSFDPARSAWGANVQRVVRRREEMSRWARPTQSRQGDWLMDIGSLEGLSGLDQGLGYEFKPYSVLERSWGSGRDEKVEWRNGFDASWRITPALTAMMTVNTDFAETEVDDRQVNLGRFSLFYPEKRDFFLRDAPYFSFPSQTGLLVPFFSRNIGRSGDGEPVDILGGVKFTGRAGPYTMGILDVQQRGYGAIPDKNLLAARITREFGEDKTVGLFATRGDPYSDGENAVLGTDFTWRTTRFLDDKNLEVNTWILGSDSSSLGQDTAFGTSGSYYNDPWELYASFTQIGEDFSPALGYLERSGVRESTFYANYRQELDFGPWRSLDYYVEPTVITTLENVVESAEHSLPGVVATLDSGDSASLTLMERREQLFEPFEIRDGIKIPEGDYHYRSLNTSITGAPSRVWAPTAEVEWGEFYDGDIVAMIFGLDYRPSPYVHLSAGWEQYEIGLPDGAFVSRLVSGGINLALSPRLSWNTVVQYDNESETVGGSSRVRWTVRPGTDVYLIANEGFFVEPTRRLRHIQSETAVKGGVTWRF